MNLHLISLLDNLAEQNIALFCRLDIIRLAVFRNDTELVSKLLRIIAEFYLRLFQKIQFLPEGVPMKDYCACYDFSPWQDIPDRTIREVLKYIHRQELGNEYDPIPIYIRYSDQKNICMACGLGWFENEGRQITLILIQLEIHKRLVGMSPEDLSYLRELMSRYNANDIMTLSEFVNTTGYNYRQFQQDSKAYFGAPFYRFLLKLRMVQAANDIVLSKFSLKEIAFKNEFSDYNAMYKTFRRYQIILTEIPRIAV